MLDKIINGETPRSDLLKAAQGFKKPALKKSSDKQKSFLLHTLIKKGSSLYALVRSPERDDDVMLVGYNEKTMTFRIVASIGTPDYSLALAMAKKQLRDKLSTVDVQVAEVEPVKKAKAK